MLEIFMELLHHFDVKCPELNLQFLIVSYISPSKMEFVSPNKMDDTEFILHKIV